MSARELLPLRIGSVDFALDAGAVEEVLAGCEVVAVPEAPPAMHGLALWRSRAVAVIDLGLLTGVAPALSPSESRARTVVARHEDCHVAIPVDQVREVRHLAEVHAAFSGGVEPAFCTGEVRDADEVLAVIDLAALVDSFRRVPEESR